MICDKTQADREQKSSSIEMVVIINDNNSKDDDDYSDIIRDLSENYLTNWSHNLSGHFCASERWETAEFA